MNIIVTSRRNQSTREAQANGYKVMYVGKGTALANPFSGQENGHDLYRKWLWRQMTTGNAAGRVVALLRDRVFNGEKIALECWCAPNPCHAHIIARAVNWAVEREMARANGEKVEEVKLVEEVKVKVRRKRAAKKQEETNA